MFSALDLRGLIDLVCPSMAHRPTILREYLDQQTYSKLLTENARLDFIAKTYGAKLEAKWQMSKAQEPAMVQQAIEATPGETETQKLLAYIVNTDPTPNKELTQWLVQRYLQGQFRLEDAQAAHDEVLPDFLTMRRNLPPQQRDINRYRNLGDIRTALRSTQEQDIPAEDPVLDAEMHKQAEVIYNGPDVKIIVPKTVAASCYFGKGTDWCTAKYGPQDSRNYYNTYSSQGPLYIVYDKKTRKRVQMHFETGQFMDEADRPINLGEYLEQHPAVFKAIGADKFVKFASKIGLRWFGPEYVKRIPTDQLVNMIYGPADLRRVPIETQNDPLFIARLLRGRPQAIAWLPREAYESQLEKLVESNPGVFAHLPSDLQNAHLADIAAANSRSWQDIQRNIPEQWMTPEVRQHMWNQRIRVDNQLHLRDVPEDFRSTTVIEQTLARFPQDIEENVDLLDSTIAHAIGKRNIEAIAYLPQQYLDPEMAEIIEQAVKKQATTHHGVYGPNSDFHMRPYRMLARFPSEYWSKEVTEYLAKSDMAFPYERIPERFRTPEITATYLKSHPKQATTIPDHYMTDEVLHNALTTSYWGEGLLSTINPHLLTDKVFAEMVHYFREHKKAASQFYNKIPAGLRRPEVRSMFMTVNAVPIAEMVPNDVTEDRLLHRVAEHAEETANIPHAYWTPEFAVKVLQHNFNAMPFIPDNMLSEPLLWEYLGNHHRIPPHDPRYNSDIRKVIETQIKRFAPNMWSSRTYAAAIRLHFLPARVSMPANLVDHDVAGAILGVDPTQLRSLPSDVVDDAALSQAVKKNLKLLEVLPKDRITEPVAFAAMDQWAPSAAPSRRWHYSHEKETKAILETIPKPVWSKRVYKAAVGFVVNLKAVPAKFRDTDLIKTAIGRDASNVRFLRDPAKFMNDHVPLANQTPDWKETLEANGVIPMKKGTYVNIRDMEKKALPSGYQVGILPLGRVNKRLYLFDPKGKYICYLYTDKQRVLFPDAEKYKTYAAPLAEMAREYLGGFEPWQMNKAGVYGSGYGNNFYTEQQASRKKDGVFAWSEVSHLEGRMYVAWYKNKPALRVYTEVSNPAFGGRRHGTNRIQDLDVYNWPVVLAHVPDIMHYARYTMYLSSDYHWQPLGIVTTSKGENVYNVGETLIGRAGELSVKRGEKHVGIFGPKGLIAYGVIRKSGDIDRIEFTGEYRWSSGDTAVKEKANALFDKVSTYLKRQKRKPNEPFNVDANETGIVS